MPPAKKKEKDLTEQVEDLLPGRLIKSRRPPGKPGGNPDWKKGKPGGPGRPKMTDEEKALNKLNRNRIRKRVAWLLHKSGPELRKIVKDKETNSLDLMLIGVITRGARQGEQAKVDWVCDVMFGKEKLPPQEIDVTSKGEKVASGPVIFVPKNNREAPKS